MMWRKIIGSILMCGAILGSHALYAIVVGSYTASSRQSFLTFPATDNDNEIRGFVGMDEGFALISPTTSLDYNGFSLVNGPISLNGGTLNLLQDLTFDSDAVMKNGGIITGNAHIFTVHGTNGKIIFPEGAGGQSFDKLTEKKFTKDVNEVSWSPNSDYLVIGCDKNKYGDDDKDDNISYDEVAVLSFDGDVFAVATSLNIGTYVWSVDWHPTSNYIAVGTASYSGNELRIYEYSIGTNQLTLIDSKPINKNVYAVRWSPNGNYLAVGERTNSNQSKLHLYSHISGVLTLADTITINSDLHLRALDWSPDSLYLVIGLDSSSNKELRVYYFNGSTISLNAELEIGYDVRAVSWSPANNYIVAGLVSTNQRLRLYQHNAGAGTLTEIVSARVTENKTVYSLDWNSDGSYLAFGRVQSGSGTEFRIYAFDTATQTFSLVREAHETHRITSVRWSPDDSYIAFSSDRNYVTAYKSQVVGTSFTFNNTCIIFNGETRLTVPVYFQGRCELHANNHVLDLSSTGSLIVDPGAQLLIKDALIKGVKGSNVSCKGDSSLIVLDNVIWLQEADFTFTVGSLQFKHDVDMVGDAIFAYQTNQTTTILANSKLTLDANFTFSYDPIIPVQNLIEMVNETSQILLKGGTLHTTLTALQLSKGVLVVQEDSYLFAENSDGISFGDGSNDLACKIVNGITLSLVQGGLTYRNVLAGSMDLRQRSYIEMGANTALNLYDTLYLDNGMLLFGNNVTINYVDGVDIVGDTGQLGTLTYNII